jgi:chloramphenicol 3-O-phosphotransferase
MASVPRGRLVVAATNDLLNRFNTALVQPATDACVHVFKGIFMAVYVSQSLQEERRNENFERQKGWRNYLRREYDRGGGVTSRQF